MRNAVVAAFGAAIIGGILIFPHFATADPVTGHRETASTFVSASATEHSIGFSTVCPVGRVPVGGSARFLNSYSGSLYMDLSPSTGTDRGVAVDLPPHGADQVYIVVFCAEI